MAKLVCIDEFRNARYRPRWRPAEAIPVEMHGVGSLTGQPVSVGQEYVPPVVKRPSADLVVRAVLGDRGGPAELPRDRRERLRPAPLFDYAILPRVVACPNAAAGAPLRVAVALPRLSAGTLKNETVFWPVCEGGRIVPNAPESGQEPPFPEKTPTELVTVSLLPKRATRPGFVIPKLPAAGLLYLRSNGEPQAAAAEALKEGPLEVRMAADGPIIRVNIAALGPALPDSGFLGRRAPCFDVRPAREAGMDVLGMPPHELKVPDFAATPRIGNATPAERPFTMADSARREALPCGAVTLGPPSLRPIPPQVPLPACAVRFRGPGEQMISGVVPADSPGAPVRPVYPAVKIPVPDSKFRAPSLTSRFFARNEFAVRLPPAMQLEDVSFSSVQPRLPVRLPRAPGSSYRPGVVCNRAVWSEWRTISIVPAEPVRMLSKGDPLTVCEYRTRSML